MIARTRQNKRVEHITQPCILSEKSSGSNKSAHPCSAARTKLMAISFCQKLHKVAICTTRYHGKYTLGSINDMATVKKPATVGFVRVPANTKYTKSNDVIPEDFCPPHNFVSRNRLGCKDINTNL